MVRCRACDFTLYFNPTSSAAVIIEDDQNRILAIRRAREPAKGKLGLPGGFLDLDETLEECAIREAKEEVNLSLERVSYLGTWPNHYTHKAVTYPVSDSYFIGHVSSLDGIQIDEEEVHSIEFLDPKTVSDDEWAFPSLRKAMQRYLNRRTTL